MGMKLKLPCGCWESHLLTLEEQQVLLITPKELCFSKLEKVLRVCYTCSICILFGIYDLLFLSIFYLFVLY